MAEYIERRRLFNALADYWKIPVDWDGGIAQPCEDALAFIENAPEEDVAPVVHGYNKQPPSMFECSICGWMDWDTVLADGTFNFCPNCGARMDGDEDG